MRGILIALTLCGAMPAAAAFAAGPVTADPTTHKPSPAECAAAREEGRSLLGCMPAPATTEAAVGSAAPRDSDESRDRSPVCPRDARCPR